MADRGIERAFPLTPLQEGMLYHTIRQPTSEVYHGQCDALIEGPLDFERFEEAWRRAALRHEAFRTFFAWEGRDRPLQVVRKQVDLRIERLSPPDVSNQQTWWNEVLERERADPFELTEAPLMRFMLAPFGPERHRFVWGVHHAVMDGWSAQSVFHEVLADYEALGRGETIERPAPPSYARYVGWLEAQDAERAEAYWRSGLSGITAATPAPGRTRHARSTERRTARLELSAETTAAISAASTRGRITMSTLTVGAWALVLERYSRREDVVFGVTASERPASIPGIEVAAGLYLTSVPIRTHVTPTREVDTWLRELQLSLSEGRAHAAIGLAGIQRACDSSPNEPLFESLVVFESFPEGVASEVAADGLRVRELELSGPSDLPLAVLAYPGETLSLHMVYDPAAFDAGVVERLLEQTASALTTLAEGLGERPRTLGETSIQSEAETARVLEMSRGPELAESHRVDVVTAFRSVAAEAPHAIALRGDVDVSYGELDARTDRLAGGLLERGLSSGSIVGLRFERSVDLIVAMFACLKARCAYVPLDPALPDERLTHMSAGLDAVFSPDAPLPETDPVSPFEEANADDIAYVLFTSGSTGEPKGVVVERGHLAASNGARALAYDAAPESFLLLSSPAVDSSVAGIFWTVTTGGTLVLPPTRAEQDLSGLVDRIERDGVTHTLLIPSLWRELLSAGPPGGLQSLQAVIVAGEACPAGVVRLHRETLAGARLYNEYGPSEGTVWATLADLLTHDEGPITIGHPIPGARVYLLDAFGAPVAVGVPGEICIGGAGVARGYLGRSDLTAAAFGDDPHDPGGRLYRTGDLGRWLDDGRIEFLGRIDDQVKVRGYRVELAEVEHALESHPDVREAAVVLTETSDPTDSEALTEALLEAFSDREIEQLLQAVEAS